MRRERIFGVDFSGAKRAGKNIWIAEGHIEDGVLEVVRSQSAADFLGCSSERDTCLAALAEFIAVEREAIVALDFPFGLPKALVKGTSWESFVEGFKASFQTPDEFKKECLKAADGREFRRCTDIEARTPFSSYNLRLYRQTYYGISALLAPLVTQGKACVLPMQKARTGKPWLIEICPASWLKKHGLVSTSYKGRSQEHRDGRKQLLSQLARLQYLRLKQKAKRVALNNKGGDALDSIIAAACAFEVYDKDAWKPARCAKEAAVEGYVYY